MKMPNKPVQRHRPPSRRGVALILTLGILSLLVLVVTAFTISMRTENLAARNARDKARAEHYLAVGRSLAMLTIDTVLDGRCAPYPQWYTDDVADRTATDSPDAEESKVMTLLRRVNPDLANGISLAQTTNGPLLCSAAAANYQCFEVPEFPRVVTGSATNLIPPALRDAAEALPAGWMYITATNEYSSSDTSLAGRVTFLVVDLSGCVNVHTLSTNRFRAAAQVSGDEELEAFFADRESQAAYYAPTELQLNRGLYSENGEPAVDSDAWRELLDALCLETVDPAPDVLLVREADSSHYTTTNKFCVNSITNGIVSGRVPDPVSDAATADGVYGFYDLDTCGEDLRDWLRAVSNAVFNVEPVMADIEGRAFYWNLVNYLDADRVPQTDTEHPWLDSYGVEAVPLVNEIRLAESTNSVAATTNYAYTLSAAVWYPFATNRSPADATLEIAVWTNVCDFASLPAEITPAGDAAAVSASDDGVDGGDSSDNTSPFTQAVAIAQADTESNPVFGDSPFTLRESLPELETDERLGFSTEDIRFPVTVRDETLAPRTLYLPIGVAWYVTWEQATSGDDAHTPLYEEDGTTPIVVAVTNCCTNSVSFYTRVHLGSGDRTFVVDEAPGPMNAPEATGTNPWLVTFTNTFEAYVNDPRFNGRAANWSATTNDFDSVPLFQGLPLLHRDGVMESVGEVGYLASTEQWHSQDLFNPRVTKFLDLWTARETVTNDAARSVAQDRIHALTDRPAAVRMLFADTLFGTNAWRRMETDQEQYDAARQDAEWLGDEAFQKVLDGLTNLVLSVRGEYGDFTNVTDRANNRELLLPLTRWIPLMARMTNTTEEAANEYFDLSTLSDEALGRTKFGADAYEDIVRPLPERVSFRQSQFLIFVRAQALNHKGRAVSDAMEAFLYLEDGYFGGSRVESVFRP